MLPIFDLFKKPGGQWHSHTARHHKHSKLRTNPHCSRLTLTIFPGIQQLNDEKINHLASTKQHVQLSNYFQMPSHAAISMTCPEYQDLITFFWTCYHQELLDSRVYTFDTNTDCFQHNKLPTPQRSHRPYSASGILHANFFMRDLPNKDAAFKPWQSHLCHPWLVCFTSFFIYKYLQDWHIYWNSIHIFVYKNSVQYGKMNLVFVHGQLGLFDKVIFEMEKAKASASVIIVELKLKTKKRRQDNNNNFIPKCGKK